MKVVKQYEAKNGKIYTDLKEARQADRDFEMSEKIVKFVRDWLPVEENQVGGIADMIVERWEELRDILVPPRKSRKKTNAGQGGNSE